MDKLSLLIPSYNDPRIIEILVELKNYSRAQLEIVIQDGGSPSDLLSKIEDLITPADKLVVESDDGIFDAINRGISNCSNEYILTIGTDDFVTKNSLDIILSRIEEGSESVFFAPVRMVEPNTLRLVRYWPVRKFSRLRILMGVQYPHFGLIAHKTVYDALKFSCTNKINADYEFFYDLSGTLKQSKIGYIDNAPIMMRLGGTSTKNLPSIISHQFIMMSFAMKRNPILLIGFLLKPLYKLQELVLGVFNR
jgi:glycosyltransferase